jgi:hypothetical protein
LFQWNGPVDGPALADRVHVGPEGVAGGYYFDWQPQFESVPVGSVEAEKLFEDGMHELSHALKQGVDAFVDQLPDPDGQPTG